MRDIPSHPILSCSEALALEGRLLASDEATWQAMQKVGRSLARALRFDLGLASGGLHGVSVLALIGKGHNGGDALLALASLAEARDGLGQVVLYLPSGVEDLKPNTRRALERLQARAPLEVLESAAAVRALLSSRSFDLCLDGLLGMQFRPPLRGELAEALAAVNGAASIATRVAVDLPSGVGEASDPGAFRADLCYATGILKKPALGDPRAGKLRYLDIGFFEETLAAPLRTLTDAALDPLRRLRPTRGDKRDFGHLAILAGSRCMPGALLMCVEAALRSGLGLLTVFAPESVVAQASARLPEAMWRPWPETPEGGLALEGLWQIRALEPKASALLLGPGMGCERETQALLEDIAASWRKPLLLDADALMPAVVERLMAHGHEDLILTPHEGEFGRLSNRQLPGRVEELLAYAADLGGVVVRKGWNTLISDGESLYLSPTGNAVLSRGGSGDLLAGLMGGLFAQFPDRKLEVACMGAYWHGKAADLLARAKGQVAIRTTELLDFLSPALQCGELWNLDSPASKPIGL